MTKSVKFRRDYVVATAFIAVSFLLGACSGNAAVGSTNGSGSVPTSASPTTVPKTPAVLDVSPADLATGVLPSAPVSVGASFGTVGAVTLVGDKGNKVEGKACRSTWNPQGSEAITCFNSSTETQWGQEFRQILIARHRGTWPCAGRDGESAASSAIRPVLDDQRPRRATPAIRCCRHGVSTMSS